jgi:hypothetical protein
MIRILISTAICFSFFTSYSQCLSPKSDTISLFELKRIDSITKTVSSTFLFWKIGDDLYYGKNFPFYCFDCEESAHVKDPIYLRDYKPMINEKSIELFQRRFAKKSYTAIIEEKKIKDITSFYSCLVEGYGNGFLVKEQKAIGTYFLLECKTRRGITDGVFCEQVVDMDRIPVILNIERLLEDK